MKIACILGTRPEIIKMAPIIRAAEKRQGVELVIIHTGQHYSPDLDDVFFRDLELPSPKYNLSVGSDTHAKQTGKIMSRLEGVLEKEGVNAILVQGDTNTVMSAAVTAAKMHIPVGHVEAGLRSYDRKMPEEINRIITDHISDFLYAPTEETRKLLLKEGIDESKIFVTGNTIVDAVTQSVEIAHKNTDDKILPEDAYVLVTAHRAENVDDPKRLMNMLKALSEVSKNHPELSFVWPMHPRTKARINEFEYQNLLENIARLDVREPVGFLELIRLQSKALFVLTDSGGIQEEACILGVPCITMRDSTERPESVTVGANRLVGVSIRKITKAVSHLLHPDQKKLTWSNPFGNGDAGEQIITQLESHFGLTTPAVQTEESKALDTV